MQQLANFGIVIDDRNRCMIHRHNEKRSLPLLPDSTEGTADIIGYCRDSSSNDAVPVGSLQDNRAGSRPKWEEYNEHGVGFIQWQASSRSGFSCTAYPPTKKPPLAWANGGFRDKCLTMTYS
ncbi:hypothetical protein V6R97_08065, partial [Chromohalobacter salexigens]|uniref:hypothetical protein n=1 Tax=Chromohalobacter israelensis TaxID=141390 RepID=UPI0032E8D66D